MDKIYTIITGATSGIGKETAKKLHMEGHYLILANRNRQKAQEIKEELLGMKSDTTIDLLDLDLSSFKSIFNFVEKINNNYEKIDILINNAGVLMKDNKKTEEGFEMTVGVNFIGTFLLTELLLEKLEKSEKPKIVFVSSIVSKYGQCESTLDFFINDRKGFGPYCNSKLALMMYVKELEEKYKQDKMIIKAVHPGIVYSHIWKWKTAFGRSLDRLERAILQDPAKGARMTVAIASTDKYDAKSHFYYKAYKPLKLPKKILNNDFRKEFITYTKTTINNYVLTHNYH